MVPFFEHFLLFRASSGLFRASSWPLPNLFLAFSRPLTSQNLQNLGAPRPETSFSVHKTLCFEQFFAKFWIPGLLVPLLTFSWSLLAFSWPLLAFSWPLLGLFWPLPFLAFSWILQNLQNSGPPETSFSVHKVWRFEQFFAKF